MLNKIFSKHFHVFNVFAGAADNFIKNFSLPWAGTVYTNWSVVWSVYLLACWSCHYYYFYVLFLLLFPCLCIFFFLFSCDDYLSIYLSIYMLILNLCVIYRCIYLFLCNVLSSETCMLGIHKTCNGAASFTNPCL